MRSLIAWISEKIMTLETQQAKNNAQDASSRLAKAQADLGALKVENDKLKTEISGLEGMLQADNEKFKREDAELRSLKPPPATNLRMPSAPPN